MRDTLNIGMKTFAHILAAAFLCCAVSMHALAQTNPRERLYTVYGIDVDERASTAAEARSIALAKAEQRAFTRLLTRIVPKTELARFSMPQGLNASNYMLGLEVVSEKNSAVRYIAKLNISFDPVKVEQLLGQQGIPYVAISPDPILVIPLLWRDGGFLLWEETNILKTLWLDIITGNRIRAYVLPEGTLAERASITPSEVMGGRQKERLEGLAAKYGAGEIMVTAARIIQDSSGQPERLIMLVMDPLGGGAQENEIFPQPGDREDDIIIRALSQILHEQDEIWKAQSLTQFTALQEMNLVIPADNTLAWADTVKRLKALALVRELKVIRMALPDSFIHIRFNGTIDQLALAMEQAGLLLLPGKEGYAVLRKEDRDSRLVNKG